MADSQSPIRVKCRGVTLLYASPEKKKVKRKLCLYWNEAASQLPPLLLRTE